MSDELKLPDDLRLPDDLAACEAKLAGQMLASSRLNRDELLYRAGWAACEAKLSLSIPPPSKVEEGPRRRGARGGIPAAWATASAALAAALAVAVTLALQSPSAPPVAADGTRSNPPMAAAPAKLESAPIRRTANDPLLTQLEALASGATLSNRFPQSTGPLAMSRIGQRNRWDEETLASTDAGASWPAARAPATASHLLEEYLPANARRGSAGERSPIHVLKLWNPLSWGEDSI